MNDNTEKISNGLAFEKTFRLGHSWVCVFDSHGRAVNVTHDPECPCHLEGVEVRVFGPDSVIGALDYALIRSFGEEYKATFPFDEAKDWITIVERCLSISKVYPGVDVWIATLTDRRIPVGAMVVERYPASGVLLVTYCFIHHAMRRSGKGYSKRLIEEGLAGICRLAGIPRREAHIVFEGENPGRMPAKDIAAAPFNPETRIAWFKSIGARRLDFHYVAPPLSSEKDPVSYLDMYSLCSGSLPVGTLKAFLKEFYKVHESNVTPEDMAIYRRSLSRQLDDISRNQFNGYVNETIPS